MTAALTAIEAWPGAAAAAYLRIGPGGTRRATAGLTGEPFRWASVTKVLTALCFWVAVEEGTVTWEDPAGPEGATLADLLSHASGLAPDSDRVLAPPRRRRIYSNRGIEVAAQHLSDRAAMPFGDYLTEAVLEPLGMTATRLEGSPAHGGVGPLDDLMKLAQELLEPSIITTDTLSRTTSVAVPGLAGVLPGFGKQDPNDWGLGVEIRDSKRPHWTGRLNSAATFGHFGQAGGFVWVDPARGLALAALGAAAFGPWATEAWPALSDAVIAETSQD